MKYVFYFLFSTLLPVLSYNSIKSWVKKTEAKLLMAFLFSLIFMLFLSLSPNVILARSFSLFKLFFSIFGVMVGTIILTSSTTGLTEANYQPSASIKSAVLKRHEEMLGTVDRVPPAKRIFDITIVVIGLILSSPLWICFSLAIWLEDPGPIFFTKVSVTKGGKSFNQIKFRTMIKDAERETGPVWAEEVDSRLLRVGKVIRKMAMDELPQLLNILMGDMSFIGPRPQRTILVYKYLKEIPDYFLRHQVAAGLTGLAQVFGHYYVKPKHKLRYDLIYVKNTSFWLDFRIFLISFFISFIGGWQNKVPRRLIHFNFRSKKRKNSKPIN